MQLARTLLGLSDSMTTRLRAAVEAAVAGRGTLPPPPSPGSGSGAKKKRGRGGDVAPATVPSPSRGVWLQVIGFWSLS